MPPPAYAHGDGETRDLFAERPLTRILRLRVSPKLANDHGTVVHYV